uniref:uncharacterized protein LOC131105309 isoform X1 n=1 Tax=Doryrhamphus excisus TaxID=161450 RepID=UPI0025AE7F9B|nr:uncharacterized protein LOC131105309 isoform X1 [Doryrhamphus excisus]
MTTAKRSINESLENLSRSNFEKFRQALVDRPGDQRVPLCQVEDQNRLEVTNVLVSTFTQAKAPTVTSEVLRQIGCHDEAKKLDDKMRNLLPLHRLPQGEVSYFATRVKICSLGLLFSFVSTAGDGDGDGDGAAAVIAVRRSDVYRVHYHEESDNNQSDEDDDDDDEDEDDNGGGIDQVVESVSDMFENTMMKLCNRAIKFGRKHFLN